MFGIGNTRRRFRIQSNRTYAASLFVASAGNVTLEMLKQYIENQKGV